MLKVSVIIPLYNGECFIQEALDSVFQQTFKDYEVIVVDDGSTDRSADIVQSNTHEIKYIYQSNQDVSAARNTGIRESNGEFIAFLDQDDYWFPEKLEKQVSLFDAVESTHLVFCNMLRWYGGEKFRHESWRHRYNKKAMKKGMAKSLLFKCSFQPSTVMVRRSCFEKEGGFDETLKVCGDWDIWLRLAWRGYEFRYLEEILCYYRDWGGNTYQCYEKMEKDRFRVLDKFFKNMQLSPFLKNKAYAKAYIESAMQYYNHKLYDKALFHLKKASKLSPRSLTFKILRRLIKSYIKRESNRYI